MSKKQKKKHKEFLVLIEKNWKSIKIHTNTILYKQSQEDEGLPIWERERGHYKEKKNISTQREIDEYRKCRGNIMSEWKYRGGKKRVKYNLFQKSVKKKFLFLFL